MNRKNFYTLGAVIILLSMVLAACAPQATPTEAPPPPAETEAPVVEQPTEAAAPHRGPGAD